MDQFTDPRNAPFSGVHNRAYDEHAHEPRSPARGCNILTEEDLGLDRDGVRKLHPWAVRYTALDGRPCWIAVDLEGVDR